MTVWFTSDEHYGHSNIIEYCKRPFSDVHEMTLGLIAKHNHLVRKGDRVYHLGDFCWKPKDVADVLAQLDGSEHFLIAGNHDSCHPMHKNAEAEKRKYIEAGFAGVMTSTMDRLENFPAEVLCHHMPYTPDVRHEGREKFRAWTPLDEGKVLLHGHVHDAWRVRGRQVNVGVDVWDYAPTTLVSLLNRLANGDS